MTDPIWWFYLFWTPNFLRDVHKLDLSTIPLPLIAIYLIADVGSIGGGWLSSAFIKRGWSLGKARKTAMLICALSVTPVLLVPMVENLWTAVILIGLAAAAHQGWSANVYTLVSDSFPRQAVGSVIGIGGMAGAVGGVMFAVVTGVMLQLRPGDYTINFLIAGSIYLITLGVVHLLVPRLEQVDLQAAVKPISIGTIVGFGFVGEVFGTFAAWIAGLINAAGPAMLTYLATGAVIGGVLGIVAGIAITRSQQAGRDR
jgi:ACS family hexuronate transporter-like MFS transporter